MSEESATRFIAPVIYVQPSYAELEQRFPTYVYHGFMGKCFKPIKQCKDVQTNITTQEIVFEYVCVDCPASTDEVLVEMDRLSLRPALYEELLGFAEKYPNESLKHIIVALGSEILSGGDRGVACLWNEGNGLNLDLRWVEGTWDDSDWVDNFRFLAVRK